MKHRGAYRARLVAALCVLALVTLSMGCGAFGGDQNTFAPGGDVAEKQRDLFMVVLWPAVVILIGVMGALVYFLVRYRRRRDDEPLPKQVHGNMRLEIAWTVAPALLLAVIAVPTILGIVDLGRDAKADALHVQVTAFQWDWRFEYLDPEFADAQGKPLAAQDLHVPVGREISVTLNSLDVNHSFWVPKLAGKLDVIPGRNNRMWFNATAPGVYPGQCAEFCGIGHAGMRLDVIAESEEDFQAWAEEQLAATAAANAGGK